MDREDASRLVSSQTKRVSTSLIKSSSATINFNDEFPLVPVTFYCFLQAIFLSPYPLIPQLVSLPTVALRYSHRRVCSVTKRMGGSPPPHSMKNLQNDCTAKYVFFDYFDTRFNSEIYCKPLAKANNVNEIDLKNGEPFRINFNNGRGHVPSPFRFIY